MYLQTFGRVDEFYDDMLNARTATSRRYQVYSVCGFVFGVKSYTASSFKMGTFHSGKHRSTLFCFGWGTPACSFSYCVENVPVDVYRAGEECKTYQR